MKISTAIIEKDFWVCFILNYLFNYFKYKDQLCFKGGTSLSKVYNLINRFSEDIDVSLNWETLGYGRDEPYGERSNTKQDKFNKQVNLDTVKFIKETWLPTMEEDLKEKYNRNFDFSIDDKDKQTIRFIYPQFFEDNSILQEIRIEIGALAEQAPSEVGLIQSYTAKFYPQIFNTINMKILTLSPIRTLFEKLLILHGEVNRNHSVHPQRYSRHYYDVFQIINTDFKEKSLESLDILYGVVEFKKKFYRAKWANYDEIYDANLKLVPSQNAINELKKDYRLMKSMIFDQAPEFDFILSTLSDYESLINKKIKKEN